LPGPRIVAAGFRPDEKGRPAVVSAIGDTAPHGEPPASEGRLRL